MRKTVLAALFGLALGACSGSVSVVTVDGVTFGLDDVPVETADSTMPIEVFREALQWVIRDQVYMSAAGDEFGIAFSEAELLEQASSALDALPDGLKSDPRANLDYFLIHARVGLGSVGLVGRLWSELETRLPDGVSPNQWAVERLTAANVEVDRRYGEWRVSPDPGVYEP